MEKTASPRNTEWVTAWIHILLSTVFVLYGYFWARHSTRELMVE
jgi:hypothetical protein